MAAGETKTNGTRPAPSRSPDSSIAFDFLKEFANGNPLALEWVILWFEYLNAVDDLVDEKRWDPESILTVFALAARTYSHPFYVANGPRLQLLIITASSRWLDSNKFEKAPELWKRWWADSMRHCGNEVLAGVAMLTGGWPLVRKLSAPWAAACYVNHADRYGTPS